MSAPTSYLIFYMFNILISAIPSGCIGSLIPFMAADLAIDETEYAPMLVWISIGCFVAAVGFKVMNSYRLLPKYHTMIVICVVETGFFSVAMLFAKGVTSQTIVITIINIFAYVLQVVSLICVAITPSKVQLSLWAAFAQGAYSLGSLVASILAGFLSYHIFTVTAGLCLLAVPFCFILQSPDGDQIIQVTPQNNNKKCSFKLELMAGLAALITAGIQNIIQNWLPTYAVQSGIASKQLGAQLVTLFCLCLTGFKFLFGVLKDSNSFKLTLSNYGQLLSGVICVLLVIFHYNSISAYLSTILYGITLTMIFPILLSIPLEFGLYLTDGQISNFMIWVTLATGLSSLTGELMKMGIDAYIFSLLGWSVVLFGVLVVVIGILREEGIEGVSVGDIVPLPLGEGEEDRD